MSAPLDIDLLVGLTRLGLITINPLEGLVTRPLEDVLGPFSRGTSTEETLDGARWRVYPLRVPSGLGFVVDVRMVGSLEVGADDGKVRLTLPAALGLLAAKGSTAPIEGPVGRPDGRVDLWLTPIRGRVLKVGAEPVRLGVRAA